MSDEHESSSSEPQSGSESLSKEWPGGVVRNDVVPILSEVDTQAE